MNAQGSRIKSHYVGKTDIFLPVKASESEYLLCFFIGQTQWNETAIFGANSTVLSPLLKIPDIDRDGVPDFLVFAVTGEEVRIAEAIGSSCLLQRNWPHSQQHGSSESKKSYATSLLHQSTQN